MTGDQQQSAPEWGNDRIGPVHHDLLVHELPEGARVKLRSGAIGEVTANPRDGGWLFIRYVEFDGSPERVGEDDMVFCVDVRQVL